MRLHKPPRSIIKQAYKAALESNTIKEDDREFRDFIESVSVSKEQLAAIVSTGTSSSVLVFEALAVGGLRDPAPSIQPPARANRAIPRRGTLPSAVAALLAATARQFDLLTGRI